ncbi:hypothetical protein X798_04324 [Onchocerca flexuosa]|uniref:SAE2 domain-containing protein n=2 Tax=Onchocerca flexuosa TaxID=387005 RepID=A0A183H049_9BILA|nr:hypothetical protein X798_04324 [Onchocerca flexuosa]VDO27347.1 unnamed protein product [Onchocerca flexuosa]
MDSFLYSATPKTALSYRESLNATENSDSLDDISFLNATTSPICLVEDHEKSLKISGISLDTTTEQENFQPLLEIGLKKSKSPCNIFSTIDDIPKTPKSVEIIDLTTPEKVYTEEKQNRSPLLPTQPLPTNHPAIAQRRRCNGTLDSWINWFEPPPKPKPVNADKYALWLDISPDTSPKKLNPIAKANKHYNKNAGRTISGSFSSQISLKSLTDSTLCLDSTDQALSCIGIQSIFSSHDSRELRRLTSNTECPDENISESLPISPRISSQASTNQIPENVAELQNSSVVLKLTLPVTSTNQEETSENQLDVISFLSDDSFPLTPSPPETLQKPETLKQMSLATVLNRSNMAGYCAVPESQHARSLMKVIFSPTFQNGRKYVENELTSRFNDDGKVRRRKSERRLLHGFDCRCCASYYEALGLDQDERNKRIDQVSKHRNTEKEPSTPEYYWEIGMPNREEQRRRGQIVESNSPIAVKTRYPQYKTKRCARRRLFI